MRAGCKQNHYDLALLSLSQRVDEGVELAQRIRSIPAIAGLPLLAITPVGHRGDAAAFKQLGYSGYLTKPVSPNLLIKSMRRLLAAGDARHGELFTRYRLEGRPEFREATQKLEGKVLVVEDIPANRKVALSMLKTLGLRADLAENGVHALQRWMQGQYNLILMDCQMPEMDGLKPPA